jgi:hypothetical protein
MEALRAGPSGFRKKESLMKNLKLIIEYQCPQCGAPATLTETDRLFICEFCRVKSYLLPGDYFRYVLPMKVPVGEEIIYFPYWRFKGMLFSCARHGIREKLINISYQALESHYFPLSLKFRDQVLKMQFVSPKNKVKFLHPKHTLGDVRKKLNHRFESQIKERVYYQANISEAFNLIYSPYYMKDKLYDAVLNEPTKFQPDEFDVDLSESKPSEWRLKFLPTLCPNCAWDLEGDRDSVVLVCRNCSTAWQPDQDRLTQLRFGLIPSGKKARDITYLPFWRIGAKISGIDLDSYADLVKIANLPGAIKPDWQEIPFHFWALGFKFRPKMFSFASKITFCQPTQSLQDEIPENAELYPVTYPAGEAMGTLKIILANFISPSSIKYRKLSEIQIEPKSHLLVYVPFVDKHLELIQPSFNLSILKSQLYYDKKNEC